MNILYNERRVCFKQDPPLRVNVLFLSVIHDVPFLDAFQSKCHILILYFHLEQNRHHYAHLISLPHVVGMISIWMFYIIKKKCDYFEQASNQFNSAKASNSQCGNNLEAAEGYSGCKAALSLFQLYHIMWHWCGWWGAASWPPKRIRKDFQR